MVHRQDQVGFVSTHVNLLGETESLKNKYIFFDQLVACNPETAIELHLSDADGDPHLGAELQFLLDKKIIRPMNGIEFKPDINDIYDVEKFSLMLKFAHITQLNNKMNTVIQELTGRSGGVTHNEMQKFSEMHSELLFLQQVFDFSLVSRSLKNENLNCVNAEHYSVDSGFPEIETTNQWQSIDIAFEAIPVPLGLPWDELIDFKKDKDFRSSLNEFSSFIDKVLDQDYSNERLATEIEDLYSELKASISKHKIKSTLASAKVVVAESTGFAEDLAKLRLESAVKRPFRIAEHLVDCFYEEPSHKRHPLYFAIKMRDTFHDPE